MAVKSIAATYKASDGKEFDNQAEAENWENFLEAKEAFEVAQHNIKLHLARTQRTADGELFCWYPYTYYYLRNWYGDSQWPHMIEVNFNIWDCTLNDEGDVSVKQEEGQYNDRRIATYKFNELYRHRANAERELIKLQEDRMAERAEDIAERKAKLPPPPES